MYLVPTKNKIKYLPNYEFKAKEKFNKIKTSSYFYNNKQSDTSNFGPLY